MQRKKISLYKTITFSCLMLVTSFVSPMVLGLGLKKSLINMVILRIINTIIHYYNDRTWERLWKLWKSKK